MEHRRRGRSELRVSAARLGAGATFDTAGVHDCVRASR